MEHYVFLTVFSVRVNHGASLRMDGKMYVVPQFCFDDYYWMLASVSNQTTSRSTDVGHLLGNVGVGDDDGRFPGMRPLLLSNDQMRDHKLDLLQPREFRRWCSCHIVKYCVESIKEDQWMEDRQVNLFAADFYSREIQGNNHGSKNGTVWHFPISDSDGSSWLYIWVEI